ncbi:hypothetical protein V6N13_106736 [Hibiscus sabdariffa]
MWMLDFPLHSRSLGQGLHFVRELRFRHVVLEGNSKAIIQKLISPFDDRSMVQPLIHDATVFSRSFLSCRFSFTGRQVNLAAHALALLGRSDSVNRFWVEEVSDSVCTITDEDRRWIDPP